MKATFIKRVSLQEIELINYHAICYMCYERYTHVNEYMTKVQPDFPLCACCRFIYRGTSTDKYYFSSELLSKQTTLLYL
jgi:hypothetical protein